MLDEAISHLNVEIASSNRTPFGRSILLAMTVSKITNTDTAEPLGVSKEMVAKLRRDINQIYK
jgi:hypothetical protein